MTFQTEQNLIFAILLSFILLVAIAYVVLSIKRALGAATASDKACYMLAAFLSVLVMLFMGFHLWQVLVRF